MTTQNPEDTAPLIDQPPAPQGLDSRRRLRELLSVPERDRSDEQWDEIIELEIDFPGKSLLAVAEIPVPVRVEHLALVVSSRRSIGRETIIVTIVARALISLLARRPDFLPHFWLETA